MTISESSGRCCPNCDEPALYPNVTCQICGLEGCSECINEDHAHTMASAPMDGSVILGIYDGQPLEIRWESEQRRCMLAGVGGGNGYFGAGWEDIENRLIVDEPEGWLPL